MQENSESPSLEIEPNSSPPWSRTTKIFVIISFLLLIVLTANRFQGLIVMGIVAALIAYIFKPVIDFVNQNTKIARGYVVLVLYLLLAVALGLVSFAIGVATYEQAGSLIELIPDLIDQITLLIARFNENQEPISILGLFVIDPVLIPWEQVGNQLLGLVEPVVGSSGQFVRSLATTTVRTLGNFLFIFVISIYLSIELPLVGKYVDRLATFPGYRNDALHLSKGFGRVWGAYLRGQLILALVIFVVVWLGLTILGVRNALALALLSGLLEFVPTIGPIIGAGVAIAVAFFQPVTPYGLESWQFALIVLAMMIIIQQVENNVLVPRIVGRALNLHPLIVIVGVFMGASLFGILGAILAAPILASLKLIGIYCWRKLFDLPPFVEGNGLDLLESIEEVEQQIDSGQEQWPSPPTESHQPDETI